MYQGSAYSFVFGAAWQDVQTRGNLLIDCPTTRVSKLSQQGIFPDMLRSI